jgi:hypothetical protein
MIPWKKLVMQSASLTVIASVFSFAVFKVFEPGDILAQTASDTVLVNLSVDSGITITSPADVTMSRNLGVAANTAIGSVTWNVKTNNATGYQLQVRATNTPAMLRATGTMSIPDYQTGTPNFWSATSGNAYFGYSAYGTDVNTGTWGSGASCGSSHVPLGTLKYKGFTTSNVQIATRSATTTPTGVDTNVCFAVEQNNFYIPSGTYQATIIATAATI